MDAICIAGAGISGLTAAIHLARNGLPVKIYEKGEDVAGRFKGEWQAFENWSTEEDVLSFLERIGISPDFYHQPFYEVELIDDRERKQTIRSDYRVGFYVIRRGKEPDSIDQYLKNKALELGVEIEFERAAEDDEVRILAKGPRHVRSVARGMTAKVDHENLIAGFLDNRLAPKSYVYMIIADNQMTLAATLFDHLDRNKAYFDLALMKVKKIYGIEPENILPLTGYIDFSPEYSCRPAGRLAVGENAGFQDFLFGFGMRYALLSGFLAARSIIEEIDYNFLIKREIEKSLHSSLCNRYLFEKLGNRGYRVLIRKMAKSDDICRLMNNWYGWRRYKGLILPLAKRWLRKKEQTLSKAKTVSQFINSILL